MPEQVVGEIIHGVLETQPRPAVRHANAGSTLGAQLDNPFRRGRGGPGGWIILDEPELHLHADVLVPDLAGWRRDRMPELPDAPYIELPPDWLCEILSPSTMAKDRSRKLPIYAGERVAHVWLIDPDARILEVLRLDGETYRLVATHSEDAHIRAEPFDAIELELGLLWQR